MIKKIVVITILVGVVAVLAFGAINRTMAKSDNSVEAYGGGGYGNGRQGNSAVSVDSSVEPEGNWRAAEDHEPLLESLPLGTLDQDELDGLQFMLEEEKLARDVYTTLYQVWGLPVFNNIAGSEQTHMDAVRDLLVRYDITPAAASEVGSFNNPDLQALYDQLVAQGSQSIADALLVGGAIEEIDILDLQERMAQTDQEDIQMVYQNLERGSINHLSAFSSNYSRQTGETYQPQYMDATAYQNLLATVGGNGGGQGSNGRGGNGGGRR